MASIIKALEAKMKKVFVLMFMVIAIIPAASFADELFQTSYRVISYDDDLTLFARKHTGRSSGEEQTLISEDIESGGCGGPIIKISGVSDIFCVLVGGRGGWIINHMFLLGGGGYGLVSDVFISGNKLNMEYGGLYAEYIFNSDALIHFTVGSLIGIGTAHYDPEGSDSRSFFVLEPEANVELNVVTFFRVCAGVSYRFSIGASGPAGLNDATLSGLSANLFLKFGYF
jgi:hypothetical protein